MEEVEWTNVAVIQLIQEYRKKPELWDTNYFQYRAHTAKYKAWSHLASIFECDIIDVRKKLNSVFASHRRVKAIIRGGGRSSWFLYPYLRFLPSHLEHSTDDDAVIMKFQTNKVVELSKPPKNDLRQSQTQDSDQTTTDDDDNDQEETVVIKNEPEEPQQKRRYVPQNTSKPRLARQPLKRRLVRDFSNPTSQLDSKLIEALKLLKRSELSRKKDECDSFGEYIATSLRKHDERTQSMIKQAINNILFEQEMKKYSGGQYTVVLTNMEENPLVLSDHETEK